MGAALARATVKAGHQTTLILGPVEVAFPAETRRFDVETAAQMLEAVLREFPKHDLLIMAAAVADYRPKRQSPEKLTRDRARLLELEPTEDVIAAAGKTKQGHQRTVGFSLESSSHMERVVDKLRKKNLDLIVYNPVRTIGADSIEPALVYADGRIEKGFNGLKREFADTLIERAVELFQ